MWITKILSKFFSNMEQKTPTGVFRIEKIIDNNDVYYTLWVEYEYTYKNNVYQTRYGFEPFTKSNQEIKSLPLIFGHIFYAVNTARNIAVSIKAKQIIFSLNDIKFVKFGPNEEGHLLTFEIMGQKLYEIYNPTEYDKQDK